MSQVFQVLRCVQCEKFQVHQTKKAKKWACKVCGEKQSYIKIYFTGSARECRTIVQQANYQEGEKKTAQILRESPNNVVGCSVIDEAFENEDFLLNDNLDVFENETSNLENFSTNYRNSTKTVEDPVSMLERVTEVLDSTLKKDDIVSNKDFIADEIAKSKLFPLSVKEPTSVQKRKSSFSKNTGFQKILKAAESLK